jgi:pentatricopeptide repeat protein
MIAGYAKHGFPKVALAFFHQMRGTGIQPNHFTFSSVLPACASLASLEEGVEIHRQIISSGFECDAIVGSALIDMYVKCGNIKKAREVFDEMHQQDLFSWTSMIAGYAQNCEGEEAMGLFRQMRLAGLMPDLKTLASVLPACAIMAALRQGMEIHAEIIRRGFGLALFVASALVDMYAKCGSIEKARRLFEKLQQRDVLAWTVMIAGHAQNGQADQALELFEQMQEAGFRPDSKTFTSVLPACANLAALEYGTEIHERIIQSGLQSDVVVVNALIDMYGKCGSLKKARELFDNMHERDVVSWTSMISGYALHGYGNEALGLFEQMKPSGVNPNHITLVCVLTACCHAGLVEKGQRYFKSMNEHYQVTPTTEHYSCMVDLLGRAGQLHEAHDFIYKMPIKPDANVWTCLLGACAIYNHIKLGECAAERLFELDPKNPAPYVLLSNIYAAAGRWGDTEKIWKKMKDKGVKKTPGSSWIEVDKQVHAFLVGDKSHPQMQNIYDELERLSSDMKVAGYVPDTKFVRNDVEEEQKQQLICHHSEKLAIVFGLLNTAPGTTIRVIKNLRVCGDCHSATKFISKIVSREIVVRDTNRYHHFKDGQCSCGDYW